MGYEGDFEGTSVHTPVPAFTMENELPVTVDMFRHDTSDGRSLLSLLYAGPPTRKPSALKKGCAGEEGMRGGEVAPRSLCSVLVQAVGWRSARLTFVCPAELLNKMK